MESKRSENSLESDIISKKVPRRIINSYKQLRVDDRDASQQRLLDFLSHGETILLVDLAD